MADRIYTRVGDSGETSLVGGRKACKSGPLIQALGDLDEASCALGLARMALDSDIPTDATIDDVLHSIQNRLLDCCAMLAAPPDAVGRGAFVSQADVTELERFIDERACAMAGTSTFVLPGGSERSARLHLARAVVRRAERSVVLCSAEEPVDPVLLAYINRLSDVLFVMARCMTDATSETACRWTPDG